MTTRDRAATGRVKSVETVVEVLQRRFGAQLVVSQASRAEHGSGEGMRAGQAPDAVLLARSTADVATAVAICSDHRFPVIAHGAGTSLEGHLHAIYGGLSIDLRPMDRIIEVNAADLDCRVEAGVTREALNASLRDQGLFFPIDPGADATLGGMAATRASGTNAVRYGTMRENVLGLTVVTPTGSIIRTGTRARKSAAGYDLTRLYLGSEGTLGIMTEIGLRLFGIPEETASAAVAFPTIDAAVATVVVVMQLAVPVARMELLDEAQMRASIAWSNLERLKPAPTLFLEFHGSAAGVREAAETVRQVSADAGGADFQWATLTEERNRLWKARHNAWYAARGSRPGAEAFATDACVPISALPEAIDRCRREAARLGIHAPIVGHVGDGNFHMILLYNPADAEERQRAEGLSQFVASTAIALSGTATGEHGIGIHKLARLREEHGPAVGVMAAIKQALDPLDIMNPGKTVPLYVDPPTSREAARIADRIALPR
jgi:D-lactate dehydrogenase (cytochrome)